jgi:DNA glycosylase AlkZ-like
MPATFLVDGFVAGTWRHERGRVHLEPWRRLTRTDRKELESESARLADFLSG